MILLSSMMLKEANIEFKSIKKDFIIIYYANFDLKSI